MTPEYELKVAEWNLWGLDPERIEENPFVRNGISLLRVYYSLKLKNGKPGKRLHSCLVYYAPLYVCDLCAKRGTARTVNYRSDCWRWNCAKDDYLTKSKNVLCVGCWNKVRAIVKKEDRIRENKRLIDKLLRNMKHECEKQN